MRSQPVFCCMERCIYHPPLHVIAAALILSFALALIQIFSSRFIFSDSFPEESQINTLALKQSSPWITTKNVSLLSPHKDLLVPKASKFTEITTGNTQPPSRIRDIANTTSRPCYRHCENGYHSRIVIYPGMSGPGAGLNDRRWILWSSANFAAFLCAKLVAPSPHKFLARHHNHGQRVSKHLTWKDGFFDVTLLANNQSALIQTDRVYEDLEPKFLQKYPDSVVLRSLQTSQMAQDFHTVFNLVQKNSSSIFLWYIGQSYWHGYANFILPEVKKMEKLSDTGIHTMVPTQCWATKLRLSPLVQSTVSQVLSRISGGKFGYLHLRRGDAVQSCDTSVSKVREYLSCSMNGTFVPTNKITMVLSTDERSQAYLSGIKEVVESFGFEFMHLDETINFILEQRVGRKEIPDYSLNNHFTFLVVNEVSKRASFYLERRRETACWDCADWLKEKIEKILHEKKL